jgi:hypothetical protein
MGAGTTLQRAKFHQDLLVLILEDSAGHVGLLAL